MSIINNPSWSSQTQIGGSGWAQPVMTTAVSDTWYQQIITQMQQRIVELERTRGLTNDAFKTFNDGDLILELVARGYQVGRMPDEKED